MYKQKFLDQGPVSGIPPVLDNIYELKQDVICEWTASSLTNNKREKVYTIHDKNGKRKTNLVLCNFYECLIAIALDDYSNAHSLDFLKVKSENEGVNNA